MKESFFKERGIYYRVSDMRTGLPTLVFLHGLMGSSSAWIPFEQRFEGTHNIITLDLRGHGKSRRWSKYIEYDFSLFAEDVRLLLQHLDVSQYVIVAHCFGTLIALQLALTESGVQKIVLLSPIYALQKTWQARLTRIPLTIVTSIFSHLPSFRQHGHHIDYSAYTRTVDWDFRRILPEIWDMGIRSYLQCLRHVYVFAHDQDWRRISVPTLILHGARDSFVPVSHSIELARIIPNAKLEILPAANHIIVLNNVDEIAAAIEEFLGNQRART